MSCLFVLGLLLLCTLQVLCFSPRAQNAARYHLKSRKFELTVGNDPEVDHADSEQDTENVMPILDGTLAGDLGFDPLGFAVSKERLYTLREIEMKNARIAMLAAVGWPSAELSHLIIATRLGKDSLLGDDGRAPSVLNGGLNNSFALFTLGLFFAVGGGLELELLRRKRLVEKQREVEALDNFFDMFDPDGFDIPGSYKFDPLNLERKLTSGDPEKELLLQGIEVFNGRVAMLACMGYIVQEAMTSVPVVRETPQFFYGLLTPGAS